MKKVDGVENVRVSLKDGLTILDFKCDNRVTLAALRQVIKNNGFVPKDALVVARGTPNTTQSQSTFEVSGSGERLVASSTPQATTGDDWRFTVPAPTRR